MKTRTIVELPTGLYLLTKNYYGRPSWEQSCDLCAFEDGCEFCPDCKLYDTGSYSVYLTPVEVVRPAQPKLRLNTPSEARREAAGK